MFDPPLSKHLGHINSNETRLFFSRKNLFPSFWYLYLSISFQDRFSLFCISSSLSFLLFFSLVVTHIYIFFVIMLPARYPGTYNHHNPLKSNNYPISVIKNVNDVLHILNRKWYNSQNKLNWDNNQAPIKYTATNWPFYLKFLCCFKIYF